MRGAVVVLVDVGGVVVGGVVLRGVFWVVVVVLEGK